MKVVTFLFNNVTEKLPEIGAPILILYHKAAKTSWSSKGEFLIQGSLEQGYDKRDLVWYDYSHRELFVRNLLTKSKNKVIAWAYITNQTEEVQ